MKFRLTAAALLAGLALAGCAQSKDDTPAAQPSADEPSAIQTSVAPSPTTDPGPDGRFTKEQLKGAVLSLDVRPYSDKCAGGKVTLSDQRASGKYALGQFLVHANLDKDAALETAVEVQCGGGDPGALWLVAIDRDEQGKLVTRGTILSTHKDKVTLIRNLAMRPAGGITLDVALNSGSDPAEGDWKKRAYAWNGEWIAEVTG